MGGWRCDEPDGQRTSDARKCGTSQFFAGFGDDSVTGTALDDTIDGGAGNDTLDGSFRDGILVGGQSDGLFDDDVLCRGTQSDRV